MISESDRNGYFAASPMLEHFIGTGLQDLQLSENDEACTDGREPRDSGTIYELRDETFLRCVAMVSHFADECKFHIARALEAGTTADRLGSTLWLAVVGSGVTFTDDGDAPHLEAMANYARKVYCEGFYFGDDGDVYLIA